MFRRHLASRSFVVIAAPPILVQQFLSVDYRCVPAVSATRYADFSDWPAAPVAARSNRSVRGCSRKPDAFRAATIESTANVMHPTACSLPFSLVLGKSVASNDRPHRLRLAHYVLNNSHRNLDRRNDDISGPADNSIGSTPKALAR
jgi:hypothetical protein